MERYLLFAFSQYYPRGGFHDLVGSYATKEEALEVWGDGIDDWGHIVDFNTGEVTELSS